jgi:FAD/FMN-containing dehydrogenase
VDLKSGMVLDGARVHEVVAPASIDEAAKALAGAHVGRRRVLVVGGATHLEMAPPVPEIDLALSTTSLTRVAAYEPDDLTISVEAGTTAAQIGELLARHGQRLPLDVEKPERATVGGMMSAAVFGPRRFGLRGLRDLAIGARLALADGTLVRTGGMVVKNVAGYDLTRLIHGSFGRLAMLCELNLKTLPMPEAVTVLRFEGADGAAAVRAGQALLASRLPYSAIDAAGDGSLLVGCEGHRAHAARLRREAECSALTGPVSLVRIIDGAADCARSWSERLRAPFGSETATFRFRSNASTAERDATSAASKAGDRFDQAWRADLGCGIVELSVRVAGDADASALVAFESEMAGGWEAVRVIRCPAAQRSRLRSFERKTPAAAIERALELQFDPDRVFARGRREQVS